MNNALINNGILAVLPAGVALADDDCFVPMADWQPRGPDARLAEENGRSVRRIKIGDSCYEIRGRGSDGRRIDVTARPAALQVRESGYDDEDDDRSRRDREGGGDD